MKPRISAKNGRNPALTRTKTFGPVWVAWWGRDTVKFHQYASFDLRIRVGRFALDIAL